MVFYMLRLSSVRKLLYVVDDDYCGSDGLTMHGRAFRVEEVKDEHLDETISWFKRLVETLEVPHDKMPERFRHMKGHLFIVPARITREGES
jgi:hypothetical protein